LAEVHKRRELLLRRNVRLHFDHVAGLGNFGEIEAVIGAGEAPELYETEVNDILTELRIEREGLIVKSYFELMSDG
jgi:predicted adenylyl cyclase CyaB